MTSLSPAILTIFGITGDLASRKLLPSLYNLAKDELLPDNVRIVGITRRGTTPEKIGSVIEQAVKDSGQDCEQDIVDWIVGITSIVTIDITKPEDYKELKVALDKIEDELGVCLTRLFYLAIPSQMYAPVVKNLALSKLNTGCQHEEAESRLLVEKPFGYDVESAKELIEETSSSFDEKHIYRIDHYLAKETVQNILTFRFENPLFSSNWDNKHIAYIAITVSEEIDIEGRTVFYEQMGALRDVVQSHLLQLMALVTMEHPESSQASHIHASKERILKTIRPLVPTEVKNQVVRGQYVGYKDDVENQKTNIETFVAMKLSIDNDRWRGVPMFLRTGKAMREKATEITVAFKETADKECTNYLTMRLQPNEGIILDLRIKKPGYQSEIQHVQMDFCYQNPTHEHPDAYERVIYDAMRGDKTLFATSEEVLASWQVVQPMLEQWQKDKEGPLRYKKGSWGPDGVDRLLEPYGAKWMTEHNNVCAVHILPTEH